MQEIYIKKLSVSQQNTTRNFNLTITLYHAEIKRDSNVFQNGIPFYFDYFDATAGRGVVGSVLMVVSELVSPGDVAFNLISPDSLVA
jgi:hypothetical protein